MSVISSCLSRYVCVMLCLSFCVLLLNGCASIDRASAMAEMSKFLPPGPRGGFIWVQSEADRDTIEQRVAEILAQPLTSERAVEIAWLNHKGLQASFAELGIAQADRAQAGRLANPGLSLGRTRTGAEQEIERGLRFDLMSLWLLPKRKDMEQHRYEQVQRDVATEVLRLAYATRKAFLDAVAARQRLIYLEQVMQAAQAGAELSRRMAQAGHFNSLQQAREQSFYAEAVQALTRAQRNEKTTRERLGRWLGLESGGDLLQLPERLNDLPPKILDKADIKGLGLDRRLDIQSAKLAAERAASHLGLTRVTRFINVFEYAQLRQKSDDGEISRGWEIHLELPLFDWGEARVAKAESLYMQAVNQAADTALQAASEVREAHANYEAAFKIAQYQRDELLPLQKRISEQNLLRYNAMLIGVFELLADARAQIQGVLSHIDTLHEYWLSEADLDMALVGPPTLTTPSSASPPKEVPARPH
ncbi:MAG: TolC family protein [Burkholderiales bacterium]